jgi:hypothetical protein
MPSETSGTPLIRTDFSDDDAWAAVNATIRIPSEDGILANVTVLGDRAYDGAGAEALRRLFANHAVIFVADATTMSHPDRPLLCVEIAAPGRAFRVIPGELWAPENNLSLANLDFGDFVASAGEDGIFRGF